MSPRHIRAHARGFPTCPCGLISVSPSLPWFAHSGALSYPPFTRLAFTQDRPHEQGKTVWTVHSPCFHQHPRGQGNPSFSRCNECDRVKPLFSSLGFPSACRPSVVATNATSSQRENPDSLLQQVQHPGAPRLESLDQRAALRYALGMVSCSNMLSSFPWKPTLTNMALRFRNEMAVFRLRHYEA